MQNKLFNFIIFKRYLYFIPVMLSGTLNVADPMIHYQADDDRYHRLQMKIKPIKMPNVKGYFWANQFHFENGNHAGYIGIQTRPKAEDKLVIFSVFGKGTQSDSTNCRSGADGGSGTSCSAKFIWQDGHNYYLNVYKVPNYSTEYYRWRGEIVDEITHQKQVIGEYETPVSWGLLSPSSIFFDEWFPFNASNQKNAQDRACVPYAKINTYYPRLWNTAGKKSISKVVRTRVQAGKDRCALREGKPNLSLTPIRDGYQIINGIFQE